MNAQIITLKPRDSRSNEKAARIMTSVLESVTSPFTGKTDVGRHKRDGQLGYIRHKLSQLKPLIDEGAELDTSDKRNVANLLLAACHVGDHELFGLIVGRKMISLGDIYIYVESERKREVRIVDLALGIAVENNDTNFIEMLVRVFGAGKSDRTFNTTDILLAAIENKDPTLVRKVVELIGLDMKCRIGNFVKNTPLDTVLKDLAYAVMEEKGGKQGDGALEKLIEIAGIMEHVTINQRDKPEVFSALVTMKDHWNCMMGMEIHEPLVEYDFSVAKPEKPTEKEAGSYVYISDGLMEKHGIKEKILAV